MTSAGDDSGADDSGADGSGAGPSVPAGGATGEPTTRNGQNLWSERALQPPVTKVAAMMEAAAAIATKKVTAWGLVFGPGAGHPGNLQGGVEDSPFQSLRRYYPPSGSLSPPKWHSATSSLSSLYHACFLKNSLFPDPGTL